MKHMRLLFALAAVLTLVAALACTSEVVKEVEVPGETVVVEREVVKEVRVPGETVVVEREIIKEVEVPGETVVVEKEVIREVEVEVVVEKEVIKEVQVPGETVVVEKQVVKEVRVPGETVVVEKEVIREVEVEVVVEKEVIKEVKVPGETVVVEKEVVRIVEVEKPIIVERTVEVVTEVPRGEKVLRARVCCMADSFHPHLSGSGSMDIIYNFIGVHLVKTDSIQQKQTPDLAERWKFADDFKSATYYLRRGAKWHDGEPITARDVEFTYKMWMDPTSVFATQFHAIKGGQAFGNDFNNWPNNKLPGVVVVDDHTIRFEFDAPERAFIELMHGLQTRWTILPEHKLGHLPVDEFRQSSYWKDDLTQGGPYKVARHVVQQFIELVPNEDYWFGRPILDKLLLVYIATPDATEVAMHRQEVDISIRGGLSGVDAYQGILLDPNWSVARNTGRNPATYSFSKNVDAQLKDKRFRQALAYAIDRPAMLEGILKGRGVIAPINLTLNPDARPEWKTMYQYDPDKSRALLADMGWDSNRVVEVTLTNPRAADQAAMPIEQQYLADVGIKIKYNVLERSTHANVMTTFAYEIRRAGSRLPGLGGGENPANKFRREWHSEGRDETGYAADQLALGSGWDAKIESLQAAITRDDAVARFHALGDQLMEDMPEIATLGQMSYYAVAKRALLPGYEAINLHESTATDLRDVPFYPPFWRGTDASLLDVWLWDVTD